MPGFRYEEIAEDLRRRIANGGWAAGERLPPEPELAKTLGVTRQTLRRALARLAGGGLLRREQGRGTFIASSPPRGSCRLLFVGDWQAHFFSDFYLALMHESQLLGLTASAFNPQTSVGQAPDLAGLAAALATEPVAVIAQRTWEDVLMAAPAVPAVVLLDYYPRAPTNTGHLVRVPLEQAAALATAHLARAGHRAIGFLGNWIDRRVEEPLPPVAETSPTLQGWWQGLRRHGLAEGPTLAVKGGVDAAAISQVADFLTRHRGSITALVCAADYLASMAVQAAAGLGLAVPGGLSIIGIGDTPWSRSTPPGLSTVALQTEALARLAVRLAPCPRPGSPVVVSVEPQVVERHSVAKVT